MITDSLSSLIWLFKPPARVADLYQQVHTLAREGLDMESSDQITGKE